MLSKDREREVGCVSRTASAIDGTVRGTHPTAPAVLAVPGKTQFAGQVIEARILQRDEVNAAKLMGDRSPFIEYFDLDRVNLPVMVRTRRPGDRFQPLGMAGEKKVGKFLTTAKVSCDLRERILILADRERILWVYPVRISEQVKITDENAPRSPTDDPRSMIAGPKEVEQNESRYNTAAIPQSGRCCYALAARTCR